jgi:hypothetical protein
MNNVFQTFALTFGGSENGDLSKIGESLNRAAGTASGGFPNAIAG